MLIDTHKTIKDLTGTGVPEPQAEAIVRAITTADEQVTTKRDLKELRDATKRDLKELRDATKRDLKELRVDMSTLHQSTQRDIENLRQEILKTIWRGLFTATGLLIAAMALLLALFV